MITQLGETVCIALCSAKRNPRRNLDDQHCTRMRVQFVICINDDSSEEKRWI